MSPFKLELVNAMLNGAIAWGGRDTPGWGGVVLRGSWEVGGAGMQRPNYKQDLYLSLIK